MKFRENHGRTINQILFVLIRALVVVELKVLLTAEKLTSQECLCIIFKGFIYFLIP